MRAYHWLRADMTAGSGGEPPWTLGEERRIGGKLVLCQRGYHHSPTPYDGLPYAPGSVICAVDVSESGPSDTTKGCSARRRLVACADATEQLWQFAYACADRAVRLHAVTALRAAGLATQADNLAALPEVANKQSADAARDAAWAAADAAGAAWAAGAARDAAGGAGAGRGEGFGAQRV